MTRIGMGLLLFLVGLGLTPVSSSAAEGTSDDAEAMAAVEASPPPLRRSYEGPGGTSDPIEPVNRGMWWFNYQVLDMQVLRPVVHAYVDWVPLPLRDGIGNFADNFQEPSNFVNNMLVGNVRGSAASVFRLMVNSTVGLLGFVDVADRLGVERSSMHLRTVLGRYKISQGPYLMLPVLGPTTVRGGVGDVVDGLYFPFSEMSFAMKAIRGGLDGLTARSRTVDQEMVIDNALDPYATVRDFYLQHEQSRVRGKGQAPAVTPGEANGELEQYLDEID